MRISDVCFCLVPLLYLVSAGCWCCFDVSLVLFRLFVSRPDLRFSLESAVVVLQMPVTWYSVSLPVGEAPSPWFASVICCFSITMLMMPLLEVCLLVICYAPCVSSCCVHVNIITTCCHGESSTSPSGESFYPPSGRSVPSGYWVILCSRPVCSPRSVEMY